MQSAQTLFDVHSEVALQRTLVFEWMYCVYVESQSANMERLNTYE